jgi:hypothetical protein
MRGDRNNSSVDLVFLGSILRRQDIYPQVFEWDSRKPVCILSSGSGEVFSNSFFGRGGVVEKPVVHPSPGEAALPPGFMTPRAEVDEVPADVVDGIPAVSRVLLKAGGNDQR